jgi:RNA polymerase primary sigma factor
MLEELANSSEPWPSEIQTWRFKQFTGARLALAVEQRNVRVKRLAGQIDHLLPLVAEEQGWSIADVHSYALTARKLPPPPSDERAATRRRGLLEAVIVLDLVQRQTREEIEWRCGALKDELARRNVRLVAHQAHRYARGGFLRYADIFQEGCVGLMRAIEKFDPYMGYEFSTYATWWIRQSITRAIADQELAVRLPVHMVEKVRAVEAAETRLRSELRRQPSEAEVAAALPELGDAVAKVRGAPVVLVPLSPRICDVLEALATDAAFQAADEAIEVRWALDQLEPQQRQVIRMRHGFGTWSIMTLQEVGDLMGVTRERIRQIEGTAMRKLAKLLATNDPEPVDVHDLQTPHNQSARDATPTKKTRAIIPGVLPLGKVVGGSTLRSRRAKMATLRAVLRELR